MKKTYDIHIVYCKKLFNENVRFFFLDRETHDIPCFHSPYYAQCRRTLDHSSCPPCKSEFCKTKTDILCKKKVGKSSTELHSFIVIGRKWFVYQHVTMYCNKYYKHGTLWLLNLIFTTRVTKYMYRYMCNWLFCIH